MRIVGAKLEIGANLKRAGPAWLDQDLSCLAGSTHAHTNTHNYYENDVAEGSSEA
jgi:hypothetical protein